MTTSLKTAALTPEVADVLSRATIDGAAVILPEQIDRKLYVAVDKAIQAAGGLWSRKQKAHVFADGINPAETVAAILADGGYVDERKNGFFPTPSPLAEETIALAQLERGLRVLEPSAGRGNLARLIQQWTGSPVDVCEILPGCRSALLADGYPVIGEDFLDVEPERVYDRVVMNPPFGKWVELDHVEHALNFLKPGGILVAILPVSVEQSAIRRAERFRNAVRAAGDVRIIPNPDGSFEASGTGVRTVTLVVETKKEITMDTDTIAPEDEMQTAPVEAEDVSQVAPPAAPKKRGRPKKVTEPVAAAAEPEPKKAKVEPKKAAKFAGLYNQLTDSLERAKALGTPEQNGNVPLTTAVRKVQPLEISTLTLDPRLQPRTTMHPGTVTEYAEAMRIGDIFPPVTVFADGSGTFWLADGWHRVEAARSIAEEWISAEVRPGGIREAILFSSGVNADHGLRRNAEDKRRAVNRLLTDPEWSSMSDNAISAAVRVSQPFVSGLRKRLAEAGVIESDQTRIGADGRVYDTAEIGKKPEPVAAAAEPEEEAAPEVNQAALFAEPYLQAFDHVTRLISDLDLATLTIVGSAAKYRPGALEVLAERIDEVTAWMNGLADAVAVHVALTPEND